jgi:monoamine oxidase
MAQACEALRASSPWLQVHLNSAVRVVDWSGSMSTKEALVVCESSTSYLAAQVIVAVPVPILTTGNITIIPPPPALKTTSWSYVRMSQYKKVFVCFNRSCIKGTKEFIGLPGLCSSAPRFVLVENYFAMKGLPILCGILYGSDLCKGDSTEPWTDAECVAALLTIVEKHSIVTEASSMLDSYVSNWESDGT